MKVGIFGGGFKPFTSGHFSKLSLSISENDRTFLFYGIAERKKGSDYVYTLEMSNKIFEITKRAIERELPSVVVIKARPNPLVFVFEAMQSFAGTIENGKFFNWHDYGIDVNDIEKVTVYGDPTTISERYMVYVKDPVKKQKYYGTTFEDGTLKFDSGLSENDSKIIDAVSKYYPKTSNDEIRAKNLVRGSELRASISSRDSGKIERFLPPFFNGQEKSEIVEILYKGLNEPALTSMINHIIKESK